jgi:hypothetical protein
MYQKKGGEITGIRANNASHQSASRYLKAVENSLAGF